MSSNSIDSRMLTKCPDSPNCVCSQYEGSHYCEPLSFNGSSEDAMSRVKSILTSLPRTTIVAEEPTYLHATVKSAVFRFVDDFEFLCYPNENVIHVRSASRIGYSDLGKNRARVEQFRKQFAEG